MRVSVITISYNQARYLPRNRSSVLAQGADVEHVFVDPGSTDGSREMILEWARQPDAVALLEPDSGPADGLNRGLLRSTGEVWLYLNADDELPPGSIERVRVLHRMYPDVDILVGNGWTIDANDKPIQHVRSDVFTPRRYSLGVGTVLQQATSFKALRTRGLLHFNIDNRYNWDTELLFDAYRQGLRFKNVPEDLGYFRLQPESITVSGSYEDSLKSERDRLRGSVQGHTVFAMMSPIARLIKRIRRLWDRATFPGLARS